MRWQTLPGPARFIEEVAQQLRDGVSIVVAAPIATQPDLEDTFVKQLEHDNRYVYKGTIDPSLAPLEWLTEWFQLEPDQWLGWNVEKLARLLPTGYVIAIEGVTKANWDDWRSFLRDFDLASRQRASSERAVILLFVRGVPPKHLKVEGAVLATYIWSGVFGELDMLTYVDQCLRNHRKPPRHHKLVVRQIAALALWDINLAEYLVNQSERDVFDIQGILKTAHNVLACDRYPLDSTWESGGLDCFDGVQMSHPFVLVAGGDPDEELRRRVWAVQAAELLPLIEMRRRELAHSLKRNVRCPFWIDSKREVHSLDDLEIGSLAYVTQIQGIQGELRTRAQWLARCRNTLAHLGLLNCGEALDARLHG